MSEKRSEFETRTAEFAIRIIRLYSALPKSILAQVLGKQVLRSGTSVGAHVAEANHSKSAADFLSKVTGARQELQETLYWLYLIERTALVNKKRLDPLRQEAGEIRAILMAMASRTRQRIEKKQP